MKRYKPGGTEPIDEATVDIDVQMKRVAFHPSPSFEFQTSLWAKVSDGGREIELQHEYPDFKPQPGWEIRIDDAKFVVQRVEGSMLYCAPPATKAKSAKDKE